MSLGFSLRDSLRNKRDVNTVIQRSDRLEEIIDLVSEKYVDSINSNKLYKDAITGILRSLDPHTVYIPSEDLQTVTAELEGSFTGIGVEYSVVRDTIEVTAVVENGPASLAGVEIGDQLIKVGDSLVAGVSISTNRLQHLLRGKQKTDVGITLKRPFKPALKEVTITRDLVPVHSVETGIMLDAHTAFIKLNRFSATTAKEFEETFKKLREQGATQLILDLRDNPGGYLEQATSLADQFLDDRKLIVFTNGLHTNKKEYFASQKGLFEEGRLVLLVDEGSASASEILSAAVQDWDRGVLIGRRTFGKGLVQQPYEMDDGSELRLTIAKYYTPSGRCIQRSFANGRDAYKANYERRFEDGEFTGNDTAAMADSTPFYTSNKRLVFGGGGVKPDVYVPYDTVTQSSQMVNILYSQKFRVATWDYFVQNKENYKFTDIADFDKRFKEEEEVVKAYAATLSAKGSGNLYVLLNKKQNRAYIYNHIKAQIARYLFRENGYYSISLKEDEVVNKALSLINSPKYLKLIGGQ